MSWSGYIPGSLLSRPEALPPSVGERNSAAVLTEAKVRAMREAYRAHANLRDLANAWNVDVRTARHVVERTTWRHVP